MRIALVVVLATLSCSSTDVEPYKSVIETSQTAYVAVNDPDPRFDYSATIVVTLRNTSDWIVRVAGCVASSDDPPYSVLKQGTGQSAWNPGLTCALNGVPNRDLAPGQQLTDTLVLRAPWQRSVTGVPIGDFNGSFTIEIETQICANISRFGLCNPVGRYEYVPSNPFTITTQ